MSDVAFTRLRALLGTAAVERDPDGLGRTARAELYRRFGRFVTESSEHLAEYVPWVMRHDDEVERFRTPVDEYVRRSEVNLSEYAETRELLRGGRPVTVEPSVEYGAGIIDSLVTGTPRGIYGNVPNTGLITNLPDGACVEVPCTADREGIRPHPVGALPPHLAALDRAYLAVCELAVRAYLEGRREHVYHACALDPGVVGQGVSLERIWAACDELFEAHGDLIPEELRATTQV